MKNAPHITEVRQCLAPNLLFRLQHPPKNLDAKKHLSARGGHLVSTHDTDFPQHPGHAAQRLLYKPPAVSEMILDAATTFNLNNYVLI